MALFEVGRQKRQPIAFFTLFIWCFEKKRFEKAAKILNKREI